ncbi:MAG: leucine-rich repeat domain-containing protein [Ancrocorticia sp.]
MAVKMSSLCSHHKTTRTVAGLLAFGLLLPSGGAWAAPEQQPSADAVVVAQNSTPAARDDAENDAVAFTDASLNTCVAAALGKSGAEVTKSDLASLSILDCNYAGIVDIAPLRYAENLKALSLVGNAISDVSALAGLSLSSLDLTNNSVSDISPLASLQRPDFLYLGNNQITDISPLAGLNSLIALSLASNQVSDVSPLAGLAWLDSVNLSGNRITDVSPLSSLAAVYSIDLSGQKIDLPDATSGQAASLPEIRSADGAIAINILFGMGEVRGNSVTWDMPGGGDADLVWSDKVSVGFVSSNFSGMMRQNVLPDAPAKAKASWVRDNGEWFYYLDGAKHTGWLNLGGTWYYMNSSGVMQTGWVAVGGRWYFMNSNGVMRTGWMNVDGLWYFMGSTGAMRTGWVIVEDTWYFMNSRGVMQTGWINVGGSWYYLRQNGAMVTGNFVIDGVTYSFSDSGEWLR